MRVVYPREMSALDRAAIEGGIPSIGLMESAGRAVADNAMDMLNVCTGKNIAVVAGKGNNGGDGFVAARYLSNWGASVKAYLLAGPEELAPDAGVNYERFAREGGETILGEPDVGSLAASDLIIDAIFGTGFQGGAEGRLAAVIEAINHCEAPVLAVDIPSGVDGEKGAVIGPAVEARRTVTFAFPKTGLYFYPGAAYAGELRIADIGIPSELQDHIVKSDIRTIEEEEVARLIPKRRPDFHKGMAGRVLVVAGSWGLTGAASLASRAALRAGAGVVTLGIAEGLGAIMEVKLTEVMKLSLPDYGGKCLGDGAAQRVLEALANYDVLALGPGLGTAPATCRVVWDLLERAEKTIVLDADGLNCAAQRPECLENRGYPTIITPHPGELGRLLGKSAREIQAARMESALQAATKFNCVVVLKGANTMICDPGGSVLINALALPSLATAGTGDVLTGCIAALAARALSPLEAALCGVYIHGNAAVISSHIIGPVGMIAGDIVSHLPLAVSGLLKESEGGWMF